MPTTEQARVPRRSLRETPPNNISNRCGRQLSKSRWFQNKLLGISQTSENQSTPTHASSVRGSYFLSNFNGFSVVPLENTNTSYSTPLTRFDGHPGVHQLVYAFELIPQFHVSSYSQ